MTYENPELVSVVIPTFSRPRLLGRAVKSVMNQTYRNLEILIVDDNAEDPASREKVRSIVSSLKDRRIRLIENERNLGGALSRNAGIRASGGRYIAFLDDDDEYYPEKVERQLRCFENPEFPDLALVYCHTEEWKNRKEMLRVYRYTYRGNCVFEGMRDCIAATSQWMCRKEALLSVGCFSDVPCKQDSNLIVKLLVKGYSVDYVPMILSRYYGDAGGRISTQGHAKRIEGEEALRRLCRKHYDLITRAEREEVEYSFACRLIGHYFALGMKEKGIKEGKKLLRHPERRRTWGVLKRVLLSR